MTHTEILAGLDEQILKAEATLREVSWTAEGLRVTLTELRVLKSSLIMMTSIARGTKEVATT